MSVYHPLFRREYPESSRYRTDIARNFNAIFGDTRVPYRLSGLRPLLGAGD